MSDPVDRLFAQAISHTASEMMCEMDSPPLAPGTELSHYRIVAQIGEGGMGIVYKAEDTRLGRFVALKLLPPTFQSDAELRERFEQEARSLSALNHPAICTIHDFDEYDLGRFIVMEFLDGETLKDRIARGALTERESIEITLQVCSALGAAHRAGIIHCDIKPANIFLTSEGAVKILDFGIVRLQAASVSEGSSAVGTKAYMSPEQSRGEHLDARTDIFSLGVVLGEMAGENSSKALNRVVGKMTAPDRSDRIPTISDAAATLAKIRDRAASRLRWAGLAAAAIALVVIAIVVTSFVNRPPPPLAERDLVLVADFENNSGDPFLDGIVADAVSLQIGQSPYMNVLPVARVQEEMRLMKRPRGEPVNRELAKEICERAGVKVFLTGSLQMVPSGFTIQLDAVDAQTGKEISRHTINARNREEIMRNVGAEVSRVREVLGESVRSIRRFDVPIEDATTHSLHAFKLYQASKGLGPEKAIPLLKEAIRLDPDFALGYVGLSAAYANMLENKLAEQYSREAFLRREHTSERERLQIEGRYYAEGSGELAKAIQTYAEWSRLYPGDLTPYNARTVRYQDIGFLEKAAETGEAAYKLSPDRGAYGTNLAATHLKLMQLKKAEEVALAVIAKKIETATTRRIVEDIAFLRGDTDAFQQADAAFKNKALDYVYIERQGNLAGSAGRLKDARKHYAAAIALEVKRKLVDRVGQTRLRWAFLEAAFGNNKEAIRIAQDISNADSDRRNIVDAAFIQSMAGNPDAGAIVDRVSKEYPVDEIVNGFWKPLVEALRQIRSGNAAGAVASLRALESWDRGDISELRSAYYRGVAYLVAGSTNEATAAFQRVLDNRGVLTTTPLVPLSYLGIARSERAAGNKDKARDAYRKLFAFWKDADQDIPVLIEARQEFSKLE